DEGDGSEAETGEKQDDRRQVSDDEAARVRGRASRYGEDDRLPRLPVRVPGDERVRAGTVNAELIDRDVLRGPLRRGEVPRKRVDRHLLGGVGGHELQQHRGDLGRNVPRTIPCRLILVADRVRARFGERDLGRPRSGDAGRVPGEPAGDRSSAYQHYRGGGSRQSHEIKPPPGPDCPALRRGPPLLAVPPPPAVRRVLRRRGAPLPVRPL